MNYEVIAVVSLLLFGAFAALASTRLYASYVAPPVESVKVGGEKKVVQLSLFTVAVVEVVNSISLWVEGGYNVWGFALHISGQYCTVLALLSFMMMWARFLSFGDNNAVVRGVYWTILCLNGAITVVSICVSLSSRDFDDMGDRYAVVLLVDFLVIAVSMLLLSGWMLLYGLRIYTRLRVMNPASSADRTAAISALRRVNSVLLLLVVCATLRVFTLVILMVDIIRHSHDQDDLGILLWFIFSNWIPTLVPGCTLLYITRRVGLSNEQSDKASFLSSSGAALAVSSTTVPLTSDYASSSGGAVMATDSIYSSGRTLRTQSAEDMELSGRLSSCSHGHIPGHKLSIYDRDTEEYNRHTDESVGSSAAYFKHAV